jgi:hypothetical protein
VSAEASELRCVGGGSLVGAEVRRCMQGHLGGGWGATRGWRPGHGARVEAVARWAGGQTEAGARWAGAMEAGARRADEGQGMAGGVSRPLRSE